MSYLDSKFLAKYQQRAPAWDNNPLGELVCRRTYCRIKDNGEYESWKDIITRVVNGCYELQQRHVDKLGLGWSKEKGYNSAKEMFDKMFNMKFSPPGRGLWSMGTDITRKKGIYAALNNCGFTTTADIREKGSEPFRFLMDMCMLGVGVGFDVKGGRSPPSSNDNTVPADSTIIYDLRSVNSSALRSATFHSAVEYNVAEYNAADEIKRATDEAYVRIYKTRISDMIQRNENLLAEAVSSGNSHFEKTCRDAIDTYTAELKYVSSLMPDDITVYKIEDTREGWVNSTGAIIDSYILQHTGKQSARRNVIFYYDDIRPAGQLLKTFGGVSSGPDPLLELHVMIRKILQRQAESEFPYVTETIVTDLMNLIGRCVVAGNVRRSSEISLGDPTSTEFINLKNYQINPEREAWGWCSNNSIFASIGMDYRPFESLIINNGEPGLLWMDNVKKYSRMNGEEDNKDFRAMGTNPCSEQTLEDKELCCLVEVFIANHGSLEEFLRTLKFAYLYAKTVTLGDSHWVATNRVMMRNRRIGCSLTGIVQFVAKWNIDTLREWLDRGYEEIQKWDKIYSDWLAIPRSIKTTSIKPSGCLSGNTIIRCSFADTRSADTRSADVQKYTHMTLDSIFSKYGFTKIHDDIEFARTGVYVLPKEGTFFDMADKPANLPDLYIYNKNNEPEKVTKLFYNGISPVMEIVFNTGSVICTPEHKFLTLYTADGMSSEKIWKQARDLEEGDSVVSYTQNDADSQLNGNFHTLTVKFKPKYLEHNQHTYDLEVGAADDANATHSYQIAHEFTYIVTHNTVSLLAGATPGVHYPISQCYIRRVRLAKDSYLVEPLREAGFKVEPAKWAENTTVVVEFPINLGEGVRSQNDVSIWEKLSLTEFLQKHWADNQVSVTIDFDPEKEGKQIASALDYFQYGLKSVSFLPRRDGVYDQMPYEAISVEKYNELIKGTKPINFPTKVIGEVKPEDKVEKDMYCDGDSCIVTPRVKSDS